jgi:hypothetical protein
MSQKGFVSIILVNIVVIVVGIVGYFALVEKKEPVAQQSTLPLEPSSDLPNITILSPNGGEVWNQNDQYTIRWVYSGLDKNDEVYIGLRFFDSSDIDKGVCWLNKKSTAGIGYLSLVPKYVECGKDDMLPDLKTGGRYKVQIGVSKYSSGIGVADYSDNYFTINN